MVSDDSGFTEGRRQERRRYIERRAQRTAVTRQQQTRRPWAIDEAKTALDPALTVPEAALQVGRTASAVESLRLRWRNGRLPEAISLHVPPPPKALG